MLARSDHPLLHGHGARELELRKRCGQLTRRQRRCPGELIGGRGGDVNALEHGRRSRAELDLGG